MLALLGAVAVVAMEEVVLMEEVVVMEEEVVMAAVVMEVSRAVFYRIITSMYCRADNNLYT